MIVPSLSDIQRATADRYGVTVKGLRCKRRVRKLSYPRQTAMFICRTMTSSSLQQIGNAFERDHTTVLHALRATTKRLTVCPTTREYLTDIVESLSHGDYSLSHRTLAERTVCEALAGWRPEPRDLMAALVSSGTSLTKSSD